MDTYNGSLRESHLPEDLDKDFLDPCQGGQTSLFNLDITILDLTNDRVEEMLSVLEENKPMHASLHSLNIGALKQQKIAAPKLNITSSVEEEVNRTKVKQKSSVRFRIELDDRLVEEGNLDGM